MALLAKSKLKKVAKLRADKASREDAALQRLSVRHNRSRDQRAMAALLRKHVGGIAPLNREFTALLAGSEAKVESDVKKLRAKAVKIARGRKAALANMVAQRVKSFATLAEAVDVPSAKRYLINVPFEISAAGLTLDSSAIVPSNSWARFKLNLTKTQRWPSVTFRFVWENTTDKYAVITVNGYVILHGFCDLWSDGGIFGGDRYSTFKMTPTMQLQDWTTDPFPYFGKQEVLAVDMHTDSGTVWDDADSETKDVFRGYDLEQPLVLVPPKTAVGLIMSVQMYVYAGQNSGRVKADFSTATYQVGSPAVLVRVLS